MRVLVVEDNPGDARLVREYLAELYGAALEIDHVSRAADARARIATKDYDVVLLDVGLPDAQGLDALGSLGAQAQQTAIVLLTGLEDERIALSALERGAQDYVTKGRLDPELLSRTIRYAIERKRAQQELARRAHQLERSNDALRNFIGTASHELQTPLANLLSAVELLLRHGGMDARETHEEFLAIIEEQAHRLSHRVGQMLDVAALEGCSSRAPTAPVDLADAVHRAAQSLTAAATTLDVIAEGCDEAPYEGDAALLERLCLELLDNARRFSPSDTPVHVTLRRAATGYELRVADRGPGVVGDDRKRRIFEPFMQSEDVLTDKPPGMGLGLSIARRIAELHGASIYCEDNAGGGTVVVVEFPAAAEGAVRRELR